LGVSSPEESHPQALSGRVEDWRASHKFPGKNFIVFTMKLSPAILVTFPASATSNAACGFPALRSPVCFSLRFMRPIKLVTLSSLTYGELDIH